MIEEQINTPIAKLPGTDVLNINLWNKVNRAYLCKAITELIHEKLATPVIRSSDKRITHFRLYTDKSNTYYEFTGEHRKMDYWHIHKDSLCKFHDEQEVPNISATLFFIEMQETFGIKPFTLTHFIEETNNTLYADAFLESKGKIQSDKLADAGYQLIEHQMDGHPWATVNKGRIGFNLDDYRSFVPEADQIIKLNWIAVHKLKAEYSNIEELPFETLAYSELGDEQYSKFKEVLLSQNLNPENYWMMPVHEWQWKNKIVFQFAGDIASKCIVPLGPGEDDYTPQQSIRTFFNISNPDRFYVKTAISILNTSIYRGLSHKKLKVAPLVTKWVKDQLSSDSELQSTGFTLLGEVATVGYKHSEYELIEGAPYQYKELLGAVWRESATPYLNEEENMMTMASLMYVDSKGKSFIGTLIEKSGLSAEEWVGKYLNNYFTPILHIFYQHKFFFSPHGENTILVMKNYVPERIIIKDFVEEIVLTKEGKQNVPDNIRSILRDIEDQYATLFILSGVFDGVFRYISNILHTYAGYSEDKFWEQVKDVVIQYQQRHPELSSSYKKFDLFVPEFIRVCINRVRLLTYGYSENTDIPVPEVCGTIDNPIKN
ncbi:MAG: IucA/IucC family siderophore biosynthesis protein [Sporocytophaga sp.]|uniref:IucA/IucC family protein n=1 Tax=Sporocytophaga sp. TaxID=2231183 RepID=UPI001B18964D|nr:IucA/IucC family siderophore biosynthesis protein [Sporocytophaga sp.]MBO9702774.1 IucA/IucC family siderophore biosynthesis protein [Sporocytophaga sp.]